MVGVEIDVRRFADSVTVARNGQIYFTDASNAYSMHAWHLDVLEARPHGRMLNFNPTTGRTTVMMEGLAFANGIALSPREDFLVVCESWKYRCVRYWLEGERKGTSETFAENLPGLPDNIHLHAPSQTFWLGVVGVRITTNLIFVQLARFIVLSKVFGRASKI